MGSPDKAEWLSADIRISQETEPQTIKTLEDHMAWSRNNWAGDSEFSQEPLETIHFGGFTGFKYSTTKVNALARRAAGHIIAGKSLKSKGKFYMDFPKPVLYKETCIYFDTPGGQYLIEYSAPVAIYEMKNISTIDIKRKTPTAIYEKHLPQLEHLLNTFRWTKEVKVKK